MKYALPLVAVIAVATITLGITGISAIKLDDNSAKTEKVGLALGHVEFVVRDSTGAIKAYYQGDNAVTDTGDRCASELLFDTTTPANEGAEDCSGNVFDVIGITNNTEAPTGDIDVIDIDDFSAADIQANAGTEGSIMATVPDTTVTVGAVGTGVSTTITNDNHLFNFADNVNDTTVEGVLLLDAGCTESTNGECGTVPGAESGEVFSFRAAELAVTGGDTLQVTWTITVGGDN